MIELNSQEVDCATAVMLKILDGKCKMAAEEKVIMEALYHAVKTLRSAKLGDDHHALIRHACALRDQKSLDDEMRIRVYEQRLFAETMISRPVMKAFKKRLRDEGVLPA